MQGPALALLLSSSWAPSAALPCPGGHLFHHFLPVPPFGAGLQGFHPSTALQAHAASLLGFKQGESRFSLGQCQQLPGGQSPSSNLPPLVLKPLSPLPPFCCIPPGLADPAEGPFPTPSPLFRARKVSFPQPVESICPWEGTGVVFATVLSTAGPRAMRSPSSLCLGKAGKTGSVGSSPALTCFFSILLSPSNQHRFGHQAPSSRAVP